MFAISTLPRSASSNYTTPDFTAHTAACVRSFTANFLSKFWTCSFTVSTLICREQHERHAAA